MRFDGEMGKEYFSDLPEAALVEEPVLRKSFQNYVCCKMNPFSKYPLLVCRDYYKSGPLQSQGMTGAADRIF